MRIGSAPNSCCKRCEKTSKCSKPRKPKRQPCPNARSLSACQGVILLVDANDGVQAQTVANFYLAFGNDLRIIPVLNKIDLKNADPERVCGQLNTLFDIEAKDVLKVTIPHFTLQKC